MASYTFSDSFIVCTGTDITSAGIANYLANNPAYGVAVVSKIGNKTAYDFQFAVNVQIGTDSSGPTESIWDCSNEFILLNNNGTNKLFRVYGLLKMGDITDGTSRNGGALSFDMGDNDHQRTRDGGKVQVYGSHVYARRRLKAQDNSEWTLVDCDLQLMDSVDADFSNITLDLTNSRVHHTGAVGVKSFMTTGGSIVLSGTRVESCQYGLQTRGSQTLSDLRVDTCVFHNVANSDDATTIFINPDFTHYRVSHSNSNDIAFIEFRYRLAVVDALGSALSGVSVKIVDASGSVRFDTVTDAAGEPVDFPEATLQNSTYSGDTRTERSNHRLLVRDPAYTWADLQRTVVRDNLNDVAPLAADILWVQTASVAQAHTGITVTDHGASPVAWEGKDWGITVAVDTSVNNTVTIEDVWHYLKYHCSYTVAFNGKSGLDWHLLMPSYTETARSGVAFYSGVQKGVRVVDQNGNPFVGITRMQADDGTYYNTPLTATVTINGLPTGARVQLYDTSTGTELVNGIDATTWSEPYTVDRNIRLRAMYVDGTSAIQFIDQQIGTITADNPTITTLVAPIPDVVYQANNVDGSLVTGITIDDTTMLVEVNTGTVSWAELYAYETYWLYTEEGIRDEQRFATAADTANYIWHDFRLKNVTSPVVPVTITGGYGRDAATGTSIALLDTTGGPIFMAPDIVVPYAAGAEATIATVQAGLTAQGLTPTKVTDMAKESSVQTGIALTVSN